jgi:cell division protein FtsW
MRKKLFRIDTALLALVAILVAIGALLFTSAALGLVGRGSTHITSVMLNHLGLGLGLGFIALFVLTFLEYRLWRPFAPYLYGLALIATALVFTPLGFEHGGGRRWLDVFGLSVQPSEMLKVAVVLFSAYVFASLKEDVRTWKGLAAFCGILLPPAVILIAQPDFGTFGVVAITVGAVFLTAGARARDIALVCTGGLAALAMLVFLFPHAQDRIATFVNPERNPQGEGYQIKQSLIAIGSGEMFGRGFGQGVQKFTYLPEPMGDSIFAVAGEETGFVGSSVIVLLFLALALRGFTVAARAPDLFGGLLAVGVSTYLVAEAFINIAAMLALAPLTGIPLTFMSQGGSAILSSLAAAGLLLSVSRRRKSS